MPSGACGRTGRGQGRRQGRRLGRFFALRTRVFDDFLLDRAAAGTRQAVILGAGLDSRAYRLARPPGCTVFEIDRAEVLAFKRTVLDALGAVPPVQRHALAADMRHAWIERLIAAGFDPGAPPAGWPKGCFRTCHPPRSAP
ncbi:class I SAM-dependent methyltransferase [Streptomyces sp. ATexAB-D23]|uniref:SAM-dependent methyltransferase n=1 Tax=unclassified Streptomyces TaxID=2593676 RepID=UPI00039D1E21|nr:class I SAM-dependent methyltransferase [Streptomyces sp. ATexAB-D23]